MRTREIYINYLNLAIRTLTEIRDANMLDPVAQAKAHRLLGELRDSIPRIRRTIMVIATENTK